MKRIVFLSFFLSIIWISEAQMAKNSVRIIAFPDLQQEMQIEDDTLRVFNFWATWCKPCVEEMPCFTEAAQTFAGQKIKIILISLDFRKHLDSRLLPFIAKNQITLPVWLLDAPDANAWIDKVSRQWEGSIPATLFTFKGHMYFHEMQFECDELVNTITKYNSL